MNIAIITCCNANNYGAVLQTYALSYYLTTIGHLVQVIDYQPDYLRFYTKQWYNPRFDIKEWCKMILRWRHRRLQISKYRSLRAFTEKSIPFTHQIFNSLQELKASPPPTDIYIAGSDQIWNPLLPNGSDPAFYLDFGSKNTKRISYAASFAVDEIPQYMKRRIGELLSNLNAVSVREESGMTICDTLGFKPALVCDPVFLHPSDFWSSMADVSLLPETPYILVYDLMDSKEIERISKRLAAKKRHKIISVSPYHLGYAYRNYCDASPTQFLGLLLHADTIICNSLHGCIFSILFSKEFYLVDREDGLNVRMRDLLNRYGLSDRLITDSAPTLMSYSPIDYTTIHKNLKNHIAYSKNWLNQQFT